MPFVRKDGIKGLIWMPARRGPMKHPCRDCYQCAWCSDERCESCLAGKKTARAKTPDPAESKPPSEEGGDED